MKNWLQIQDHPHRDGVYRLRASQWLPHSIEEVFDFFSAARNLEQITPPWMQFHVITPEPIVMRKGLLIDYKLRVHGVPLSWQSEITQWEPPFVFVDEQKRGPYRLWHHEHTFAEQDGGTLVLDKIDYAVPGGRIVNKLLIRRDLEQIFEYRAAKLEEIFENELTTV